MMEPQNKGMQLTRPAQVVASQLIRSVGRTFWSRVGDVRKE